MQVNKLKTVLILGLSSVLVANTFSELLNLTDRNMAIISLIVLAAILFLNYATKE